MMTLLWSIFWVTTIVQLFYWLCVFSKLAFYRPSSARFLAKAPQHKVSIIICAYNEAENLRKNLPEILEQDYPEFEVIVVNDNSSDKTLDVLLDFKKKYPTLCVINRTYKKSHEVGKKFALAQGIETAQHELLLLTDADCQPATNQWLAQMQKQVASPIAIVLGYGPYFQYEEDGFLNRFIRFETVYTAIQYFSFALWGKPYMGVGRNLMYKKTLYRKVDGFKSHEHVASGDDDLFINAIAHLNNTSINLDERTFVYSEPKRSWRSYFRQKSRHLTTSTSYRLQHQVLLGLLSASHFGHYAAGLVLLLLGAAPEIVLSVYALRMGIVTWLYARILRKLKESSLLLWIPVLDVAFLLYYLVLTPVLIFGKRTTWT